MVLLTRNLETKEKMPQTVPSAGFTPPPGDFTNFADTFDLSLLSADYNSGPISDFDTKPKIFIYPDSPNPSPAPTPDFQVLLDHSTNSTDNLSTNVLYLHVPKYGEPYDTYRQSTESNFYPSSPELSLYSPGSSSTYSCSPRPEEASPNNSRHKEEFDEFLNTSYHSELFACASKSSSSELLLSSFEHINVIGNVNSDLIDSVTVKQETFDETISNLDGRVESKEEKHHSDHQLLRQALRDTTFQKRFNYSKEDLSFVEEVIKMEGVNVDEATNNRDLMEPVFNLALEQMKKDVDCTCTALGISPDPKQWTIQNVFSWLQWTSKQFNLPEPSLDQWNIIGKDFIMFSEEDFLKRSPQGGMTLYAQLEIWKAANMNNCPDNRNLQHQWAQPENTINSPSSGDVSDDEDEERISSQMDPTRSTTTRLSSGSHIHLWQFLKELLSSPQQHGACIRWLDSIEGIFKIEDSVKVARLWGRRKNRPAMNYDKLSRSIRQYYKKGIMKKTERSQRLVYQFCHPYNL